jgi:hypothetical protein
MAGLSKGEVNMDEIEAELLMITKAIVIQHTPIITEQLGISKWNKNKDRIQVLWAEPADETGTTTGEVKWTRGESPTLGNTYVKLYARNIVGMKVVHKNFVCRVVITLAHELKHIEQIKNGFRPDKYIPYWKSSRKYLAQKTEAEANEFASRYVAAYEKTMKTST